MKCNKDGCPEEATAHVTAEGMAREYDLCADCALEALNLGRLLKFGVTAVLLVTQAAEDPMTRSRSQSTGN